MPITSITGNIDSQSLNDNFSALDSEKVSKRELYIIPEGVVNDGTTNNATAFSNAIKDAITNRRKIKVPAGVYVISTSVVEDLASIDLEIEGEASGEYERKTKILWRGGAGTMFTFNNARNIKLKNIEISGYDPIVDTTVFQTGSTGIYTTGSIKSIDSSINGFETLVEWGGGYYHRFDRSHFRYFKLGFKNFNANNFVFDNCKASDFETFMTVNGGNGTSVLSNSSFERWVNHICQATSGSYPHLSLVNNYFENFPSVTPPSGITGSYSAAFVTTGFGSVYQSGNSFLTNGIRRVIYGTSVLRNVVSLGNRIDFSSGTSDMEWFIYNSGNLETLIANDVAYDILTQSGVYSAGYLSTKNGLNEEASDIYDPFLRSKINLKPPWVTPTLLNSWTQNSTSGFPKVAYRKYKNRVQIKGVVDGGAATAQAIFTLPSDMRPSEYVFKQTGTNANAGSFILRVLTTGDVRCEQIGSNGIILDGLEFDIN